MQHAFCIYPYWHEGCWAFDDPSTDLFEEPFVGGSSEVLTALCEKLKIPNARKGFELAFSDEPFTDKVTVIDFVAHEGGGARYRTRIDGEELEGWLCQNLLRYFESPPARIYLHISPFGSES